MQAVCIRQITVDTANMSITYACWYKRIYPESQWFVETSSIKVKRLSKTNLLVTKLLECIEDPENDQLAAFRGDLKRLTSLT